MSFDARQKIEWQLIKELIDNIPDAIYFKDRQGHLLLVNRAHAAGLKLRPEDVVGKTDFDFFPPHQAEQMTADDRAVMRTGLPLLDVFERTTRPDGSHHYVSTSKIPRRDYQGRVIGIMGITRDITERTKTEENRYHVLFDTSQNCIFLTTKDGHWIDINNAGLKLLGFRSKKELFKTRIIDCYANPADRRAYVRSLEKKGYVNEYKLKWKRKDGSIIHVLVNAMAQKDKQGRVTGYQGIVLDITAQKRAEEEKEKAIHHLNRRLRELSCLYRFESICRKEDLTIGEILHLVLNLIPSGLPSSDKIVGQIEFNRRKFQLGKYLPQKGTVKFPIVVNNRKLGFIEIGYGRGSNIKDQLLTFEERRLVEMITKRLGLYIERRLLDDAFRKTLKDLTDFKFALDASSIVSMTDQAGKIIYVNERFCEISQYSWNELVGKDHRIVNSGYHSKEFFKTLWTTIQGGEVWSGEVRNKAKDGTFHWMETTIVPFVDRKGNPYQYIAIRRDITWRKEIEAALKGLPQRIIQAQESERHLIAREIHDDFGQSLVILKMMIQSQSDLPSRDPKDLAISHQKTTDYLDQIINKSRDLAAGLRPTTLDILGLESALKMMIKEISYKKAIDVKFSSTSLKNLVFSGEIINLYRIVQEALTNIVMHSNASRVNIKIEKKKQKICLTIQDNGKGFDLTNRSFPFGQRQGLGLTTMDERAKLLGGDFRIYSQPGRGTAVIVTIPVRFRVKA